MTSFLSRLPTGRTYLAPTTSRGLGSVTSNVCHARAPLRWRRPRQLGPAFGHRPSSLLKFNAAGFKQKRAPQITRAAGSDSGGGESSADDTGGGESSADDDSEGSLSDEDTRADDESGSLLASLAARVSALETEGEDVTRRWKTAVCKSTLAFALEGDWVRRLAMDWPLAAAGTAGGGVTVADLRSGEVLAAAEDLHPGGRETRMPWEDTALLYGEYDGGGVTAVDLCDGVLASAGRDGVVRVLSLDREAASGFADERRQLGVGSTVSAVAILSSGERIVTASLDGKVTRWDLDLYDGTWSEYTCRLRVDLESPVLCLHVDQATGVAVAGTAAGTAAGIDLADGALLHQWKAHTDSRTRSIVVAHGCVVTGGGDGSIRALPLGELRGGPPDAKGFFAGVSSNAVTALKPKHEGQVVALAAREGGVLISGAHDGSIRVWEMDCDDDGASKALFALQGYKVWLGSVVTDGKRLVSDGRDNAVLMHDFTTDS